VNLFTFGLFNSQDFQSAEVNSDSLQSTESLSFVVDPERVRNGDTLISPIEHPSEAFECLDCFLVDTLNEHGRCARCGSNAVMQYLVLEKPGLGVKVASAPFRFH
jgi:hypothetical protein